MNADETKIYTYHKFQFDIIIGLSGFNLIEWKSMFNELVHCFSLISLGYWTLKITRQMIPRRVQEWS